MEMKREPTQVEKALLSCALAIDAMGLEIQHLCELEERTSSSLERISRTLAMLEDRERWIEHYRADERPLEELRGL